MSEHPTRFFPVLPDPEFGFRLHDADLAVNKVLAAAQRRYARDVIDIVSIDERYAPLGPLVWAAVAKTYGIGPKALLEELRRRGLGHSAEEFASVRSTVPIEPATVREAFAAACERASVYCTEAAPVEYMGHLLVDASETPVAATLEDVMSGRATARPASEAGTAVPRI